MANKICIDCFKDIFLKKYVHQFGTVGICNKCGKQSTKVILIDNKEFQNRFKASFRYYYSEILYNPHWSGYSHWIYLLSEENEIFESPLDGDEDEQDSIYNEFYEIPGHVSDYDLDVSLYFGGERLDAFFLPIRLEKWNWISKISSEIEYNNPNVIEKLICDHIENLIKPLVKEIQDINLYRARIGIKTILTYDKFGDEAENVYIPYKNTEIGAPWPKCAGEGRFNRSGTAYVYLASTKETAINEVKPSVGQHVSIGQFKIINKIKIVNFANIDFYDYAISDNMIEEYIKLKSIEMILSIPNPDKEYRLTQGFSDAFISLGYDGIMFNSSVSDGTYNMMLFHRKNANYIDGTEEVIYIRGLSYDLKNENIKINEEIIDEYIDIYNPGDEYKVIDENFGIKLNTPAF